MESKYYIWLVLLSVLLTGMTLLIYYYWRKKNRTIVLPAHFLLDEEHETKVIKSLRKMMSVHGKNVFIDFSEIKTLSYESYMILIAQGEKVYNKGKSVYLQSVSKCDKELVNIIKRKNKNHRTLHSYVKLKDSYIPFFQNTKINPQITTGIETELKRMGIKNYYEFNTLLTELLGNAIEHGIKKKNINWWLYQYRDREEHKMFFAFADMGIGIIDSYKKAGLPSQYKELNDEEILLYALEGKLGSSTKQPNRGRGLPQLRHMVEKKWISDFVLITNRVSLRYINDNFVIKQHPNFVGTYYYWTINKENYTVWKRK